MASEQEQAFELFGESKSVNSVAKSLFNSNWGKANQMKKLYDEQRGGASQDGASEAGDAEAQDWELSLNVPTANLDAILASLTPAEKAIAAQSVIEARVDAMVGPAE